MRFASNYDAAFSGFRVVRAHPRAILVWAAVCFAFNLSESLFGAASAGRTIARILDMAARPKADLDQMETLLIAIAPTYVVLLLASMMFFALFFSAANRAVLRPSDDRFAYLGLGKSEVLQFSLIVLLFGFSLALYMAIGLAAGFIGGLLNLVGTGVIAVVIAVVLLVGGLGYVWLRLSLASPLTFTRDRVDLFGSWRLTGGYMWSIARVYLMSLAAIGVVYLVGLTFILAVMGAVLGDTSRIAALAQADFTSPASLLSLPRLVLAALQAGLTALILPLALCPAIEVYRRIAGAIEPGRGVDTASPTNPWG